MDRLLPITRWCRRSTTGIDNFDHNNGCQHNIGRPDNDGCQHNLGCYHLRTTIDIGAHRLDNDFFPASDIGTRIDDDVDDGHDRG